jgi:hypothetical protein
MSIRRNILNTEKTIEFLKKSIQGKEVSMNVNIRNFYKNAMIYNIQLISFKEVYITKKIFYKIYFLSDQQLKRI